MTDDELAQLWPRIVSEARRALARYGARGMLNSPEDVASRVAVSLWANYSSVTAAALVELVRRRTIDWLRVHGRDGRAKWQPPVEVSLDSLPPAERLVRDHIDGENATEDAPGRTLARIMAVATKGQKTCLLALIRRDFNRAEVARDMGVTRNTVDSHLHDIRKRFKAISLRT